MRRGVTGVVALILTAVALPPLLSRLTGGHAPRPGPQLAALATVATLPATAAVAVAAFSAWWLALLLAIPAAILLAWQLPPRGPGGRRAAAARPPGPGPTAVTVRVLTLNARGGWADPAALLSRIREHQVDVLAVQELTREMVGRLDQAGLASALPYSHVDPRPDSPGVGLWARWPLAALPPVPGMEAAAPRAGAEPVPGHPVVLTAVHPAAPQLSRALLWQRDLTRLLPLAGTGEPQIVMGDFNATRDHQAFRDLLDAGFVDCADVARHRPWPGFTWPASWDVYSDRARQRFPDWPALPLMRLDHVLVTPAGTTVRQARPIRVPGTDHLAVLAVIEFSQPPS